MWWILYGYYVMFKSGGQNSTGSYGLVKLFRDFVA